MINEDKLLMRALLDMGEALLDSGAEIYRAEDTLRRIGYAYGAVGMNVFIVTSCIVLTIELSDGQSFTQTRRVPKLSGNDFIKLEKLNALSRQVCTAPIEPAALCHAVREIRNEKVSSLKLMSGCILVTFSFSIFFGGNMIDALAAALVGILIWALQKYLAPFCMNTAIYQLLASLCTGSVICLLVHLFPALHMDAVMIGDIMLLIPGIMFTNGFRDLLLGDILSGCMRLIEALLIAAILALGFIAAIWIFKNSAVPTQGQSVWMQLLTSSLGSLGFALVFHSRWRHLIHAFFGGLICWSVYLSCQHFYTSNVFVPSLLSSLCVAIYAEIIARVCRLPSTPIFITSVVTLVPGRTLYYCMQEIVEGHAYLAAGYGLTTLLCAIGIAAGMCIAWAFCDLSRKITAFHGKSEAKLQR